MRLWYAFHVASGGPEKAVSPEDADSRLVAIQMTSARYIVRIAVTAQEGVTEQVYRIDVRWRMNAIEWQTPLLLGAACFGTTKSWETPL